MHSVLVLVLISVLQFSISFPAVAGDCFDDPLKNNKSYDNCDRCYQTLVNALIDTEDNKYHLEKTFFPDDSVRPVQVTVEYLPVSDTEDVDYDVNCTASNINCTTNLDTTWYWIMGEFYVYQPLDVFVYRSLLFAPPQWRQKSVELYLPNQCFIDSGNYNDFFGHLTQRLSLYASSQSATAEVSGAYVGKAINASHPPFGDEAVLGSVGTPIVQVVYVVPFLLVCAFFIISVLTLGVWECEHEWTEGIEGALKCLCCHQWDECKTKYLTLIKEIECKAKEKVKKLKNDIANDLQVQANLAAVALFCFIFTVYVFALDIESVVVESSVDLPEYFDKSSYGFYTITITFTIFSFLCDLIGIIWFVAVLGHNLCYKKKLEVYFPMLFCIGGALLSLSFHLQNILIAWSTDPFYASRIALLYIVIIFCCLLCFKYAYSFPLKVLRRNEDPNDCDHWNKCELITVVISLFITTVVCLGILIILFLFVYYVPINNSIEQSVTGITTIFNGAVILIGGFVAYSVGIQYFGNPFSLEDALKNAMNEINKTPFNPGDNGNWSKLTEEGRMTEVMKALIYRETSKGPPYNELPHNPTTQPPFNSPTQIPPTSPTQHSSPIQPLLDLTPEDTIPP